MCRRHQLLLGEELQLQAYDAQEHGIHRAGQRFEPAAHRGTIESCCSCASCRILIHMNAKVTGTVQGKTIKLDEAVPPLDGCRVRVTLEPLSAADVELTAEEQTHLLREWAARGPHGPLEAENAWPDESH